MLQKFSLQLNNNNFLSLYFIYNILSYMKLQSILEFLPSTINFYQSFLVIIILQVKNITINCSKKKIIERLNSIEYKVQIKTFKFIIFIWKKISKKSILKLESVFALFILIYLELKIFKKKLFCHI